jgi:hypothetical protein
MGGTDAALRHILTELRSPKSASASHSETALMASLLGYRATSECLLHASQLLAPPAKPASGMCLLKFADRLYFSIVP